MNPPVEDIITDITKPVDNIDPIDDLNIDASKDDLDGTLDNEITNDDITDDEISSAINKTDPSDVNKVSFTRGADEAYMDTTAFPITVALAYSEITPITKDDFKKDMTNVYPYTIIKLYDKV